jgi:murein DD-endopeptidase MepM/ murein hydrolase activator NlpD
MPLLGPENDASEGQKSSISVSGSIQRYTVQDGETLSGIAARVGVSVNTLLWANDITNPALVRPGTELVVLPVSGIRHTVKSGDTLAAIAKRYGADQNDIAAFNGIEAAADLKIGSEVIVPGGELSSETKKAEARRATTRGTTVSTGTVSDSSGFFTSPVPGAVLTQGIHGWNGVDLGAPNGTPIYAAAAGTVIVSKVGGFNGGYGNYIVIDHGNGVQTLYSHLATDLVSVGQDVGRGERIGTVGMTGAATGFHLHFEVRGARNPFAGCAVMSRCSL